jgi:L-lactate dehydrogenase complex protein LldF
MSGSISGFAPNAPHAERAVKFLGNTERSERHDKALWFVRTKRDRATALVPEWEDLRLQASRIKAHTVSNLDTMLTRFEENCAKNGVTVHWAADAADHNRIVHGILAKHGAKKIVKSKSMLTEECGLNDHLHANGMETVDTDLGEYIVQLRKEPPSHIVLPAIHTTREDIGELFHEHLGTEAGNSDPEYLTRAARVELRRRFIEADAGITGVNFAIAETGGIVVCTNEGNADLGMLLPKVHIACMGIEKLIPNLEDLAVFTRLLARAATGQHITTYTSVIHKPRPGAEMHVVIVDNGRSVMLGREEFRESLNCIRCGACMNTCPVFRRTGGHSYGSVIPGPIGSILSPSLDLKKHASLPFASTLCGSCTDVCPVKIPLHEQLLAWRKFAAKHGGVSFGKRFGMGAAAFVFRHPKLWRVSGKLGAFFGSRFPGLLRNPLNPWIKGRAMPEIPAKGFRELYAERQKKKGAK